VLVVSAVLADAAVEADAEAEATLDAALLVTPLLETALPAPPEPLAPPTWPTLLADPADGRELDGREFEGGEVDGTLGDAASGSAKRVCGSVATSGTTGACGRLLELAVMPAVMSAVVLVWSVMR
jgi:hypothetical protein